MFNVGPQEMLVLLLVGVIVFGPDKLPAIARQAAQLVRALRELSDNARKQISELSPELGEELGELNALRRKAAGMGATGALQKILFDGDDDPLGVKAQERDQAESPADVGAEPGEAAAEDGSALSLAKQLDAAQIARAAVPVPDTAPPHLGVAPAVGAAASLPGAGAQAAGEPAIQRAALLGGDQQPGGPGSREQGDQQPANPGQGDREPRDAPPVFDDVT
ncbi:MAG: twin-arginine translocase TatA/TatE family subunit [Frankiaceae bacterium]|nr:twin-arginine translocase TatA/TatE family subunit [Frankiaceae bacterium]